jgi:hypothetical protein
MLNQVEQIAITRHDGCCFPRDRRGENGIVAGDPFEPDASATSASSSMSARTVLACEGSWASLPTYCWNASRNSSLRLRPSERATRST